MKAELDNYKSQLISKQSAVDILQRIRARQAEHILLQRKLLSSQASDNALTKKIEVEVETPTRNGASETDMGCERKERSSRTSPRGNTSQSIIRPRNYVINDRPPPTLELRSDRRHRTAIRRRSASFIVQYPS